MKSYNRYSYCWNNPLKYSDPSGYYTIDLDGLVFNINGNHAFYRFLGDNWDNFATISNDKGLNITYGEMLDIQGKFYAGRNYLHERGMWHDYSFYYSTKTRTTGVTDKQGFITYAKTAPTLYVSSRFISFEDFFWGIEEMEGILSEQENDGVLSNTSNYLGTGMSSLAGLKYTSSNYFRKGYWRAPSGNFWSADAVNKGWSFEKSLLNAKNSSKWLRWSGNTLGLISTGISLISFVENPNVEDGLETGVGIASMIFWEVAPIYYIGKGFYWLTQHNTQYYIDNDINPGMQFIFFKE